MDELEPFLNAVEQCLDQNILHAALALSLTLPDICSSLDNPDEKYNSVRYKGWTTKWLEPEFLVKFAEGEEPNLLLSAEDIYQARNSILHAGSAEIQEKKRDILDRFSFHSSGRHLNLWVGNTVDGEPMPNFVDLTVSDFCRTILGAVRKWYEEAKNREDVRTRMAKLLHIH